MIRQLVVLILFVMCGGPAAVSAQPPTPQASASLDVAQKSGVGDRILVIPFENPGREARIYWLSEASSVLLADDLNALGANAIARDDRLDAFDELQVPPLASLSHATVIRLGQLIGASQVVIGSLTLAEDEISVRARNIRLDTGQFQGEVMESGRLGDVLEIFERVARRLAAVSGAVATGPLAARPSLQVFENYIKGLLAGSVSAQVGYLEAALALDPGFDRARLALWSAYQDDGNPGRALVEATAVLASSPVYARARFSAALSLIQLKRLEDAFSTLKALADRLPTAAVLNNLGVVQLRRAAAPQKERASDFFTRAVHLDPDHPDYYFNLGYAFWAEKNGQAAISWLREAVRRNPADGEAHAVLGAALQAAGSTTEAARERELATQLSSAVAEWAKRPAGNEAVPRGLERLEESFSVATLRRADFGLLASGQQDQKELAAFHLDRGRRFFEQGTDREAEAELRRTLFLSPYQAEAHLLMGRLHLRTGRTTDAIDAFKISLWSEETVAAHLALAAAYLQTRNFDAGRVEAQRALAMAPNAAEAKDLLNKLRPATP
jgi:tetratricopeptide (TPR) repeat protein